MNVYVCVCKMDLVLRCSICEKLDIMMEFAVPYSPADRGEHVNRGRETPKFLSYLTGA
jgi:hypothetical protein